jgi:pyruvate,orthophosphate dikinase
MSGVKRVYRFGGDVLEGNGAMREALGGKGAALAQVTSMGIRVPPGFTISTDVCRHYLTHSQLPAGFEEELGLAMAWLEGAVGRKFDDPKDPLMVSVRSGAPVSMPGMMDTILNVGLNRNCVQGLGERTGNPRFAWDCLRRLIQMFGAVVLKVRKEEFEHALTATRIAYGATDDSALPAEALEALVGTFEDIVQRNTGQPFPYSPDLQINLAILAVFESWQSDRAKVYRSLNGIAEEMGTAVTVQAMVFGNRGEDSGTGVGFTRNPSTGEKELFGEFLTNAQGEDVVAGIRTPRAFAELAHIAPAVFKELKDVTTKLERHYRDVQDFEFTFEAGELFILQTRSAKRTATAAVQNAIDMESEGLISKREAIDRVSPASLGEILSPQLDFGGDVRELTIGIAASAGAASGRIALSANDAVIMARAGEPVVLVTEETSADDIHGMAAAVGFLTGRGGATSHAAVVARGMGKCCITGAREIHLDKEAGTVRIGKETFAAGDWITLEGNSGRVFAGQLPIKAVSEGNAALTTLLSWALESADCEVRANADTPDDAKRSFEFKAAGIGLCRTEHMFFSSDRLPHVRDMILATDLKDRVKALAHLLPMQQEDFEAMFRQMSPRPVTIRLLDPPLHEFLPSAAEIDTEIAAASKDEDWETSLDLRKVRQRIGELTEVNPMMGHRGCRLSLTFPEILDMQVRAIMQAAAVVAAEGYSPAPEIMVPLIASEQEMKALASMIHSTASAVLATCEKQVSYTVGAMIELPRAALCAGQIAPYVDFISFGTNDLTQMTFGFSRDDARNYLNYYLEHGIFTVDPFQTIDREGVGQLLRLAVERVRAVKPKIKIGVCGEHAGDPESIHFFQSIGVNYVSCSPARIPIAQLAMGQACQQNPVAA